MPEMTLSEAALWAGKGRPAILKAIQKGTISATKDEAGQWRIDPSELARVYRPGNNGDGSSEVPGSKLDIAEAIAGKDREMALLREFLDEARKQRDSWQAEAAKWQAQAESQTRLLTHQASGSAAISLPVGTRRGWLSWLSRR